MTIPTCPACSQPVPSTDPSRRLHPDDVREFAELDALMRARRRRQALARIAMQTDAERAEVLDTVAARMLPEVVG